MRKLWQEFKAFAVSGNVLDLALGFLIGAAFAKLVESLANNVLMQLVAATVEQRDFTALTLSLHGAQIRYGAFLTDMLNFLILALVMFAVVKFVVRIGILRNRSFIGKQCPYCLTDVPGEALVCKQCGQPLVDELPSPQEACERLAEMQVRRAIGLPRPPRWWQLPGGRRDDEGRRDADVRRDEEGRRNVEGWRDDEGRRDSQSPR